MTKTRIPLTPEKIEVLEELLTEYKHHREQEIEHMLDRQSIRDQLLVFFKKNGITEKKYKGKIFSIGSMTSYKYPAECKHHRDTFKKNTECIIMRSQ